MIKISFWFDFHVLFLWILMSRLSDYHKIETISSFWVSHKFSVSSQDASLATQGWLGFYLQTPWKTRCSGSHLWFQHSCWEKVGGSESFLGAFRPASLEYREQQKLSGRPCVCRRKEKTISERCPLTAMFALCNTFRYTWHVHIFHKVSKKIVYI